MSVNQCIISWSFLRRIKLFYLLKFLSPQKKRINTRKVEDEKKVIAAWGIISVRSGMCLEYLKSKKGGIQQGHRLRLRKNWLDLQEVSLTLICHQLCCGLRMYRDDWDCFGILQGYCIIFLFSFVILCWAV